MNPMNPPQEQNPVTAGQAQHNRFGERIGAGWIPYRGGSTITAAMSAPTAPLLTVAVDRAPRVEFVVRAPAGVTQFRVRYGRWAYGPAFGAAGTELDGWMEVGQQVFNVSGAGGELCLLDFLTRGERVGIWIDDLAGAASESFRMWFHGVHA